MAKIIFIVTGILAAYVGFKIHYGLKPPTLPKLENTWWGPGEERSIKSVARPFTINVSSEELEDLNWRLKNYRPFTPPLEGIVQQYGMNTELLEDIVKHWRIKYNWKEREKYLNKFPQFKINIQGLDIHYLHVKPEASNGVKILPLLLVHGWPGSVKEFYEILPILTTPQKGRDFVFEVIAPHIPGYGFSQAAAKPGLGAAQIAVVFKNMMNQLGFGQFYAQGGDFGSMILIYLSTLFPETVLGLHSNTCIVSSTKSYIKHFLSSFFPSLPWWYVKPEHYNRVFPLKEKAFEMVLESGYFHIQASKPDTVGVAMNDSPIGLAAYIIEKFISGGNITCNTQTNDCLKNYFTYDDLLDNVMIYWWTKSATTSFRLYAETFNLAHRDLGLEEQPVLVPAACARFSNDLYTSDGLLKDAFPNLIQLSDYEGGHFAALQLPKVLAEDVFEAVDKFQTLIKETN